MIPYREEKIVNAIGYFASEHKKKTGKELSQTFLYKYLAFFDFRSLDETGEPALCLHYKAMERGPVPKEIYTDGKYRNTELYEFVSSGKAVYIHPKGGKVDRDVFSKYEKGLLDNLIEMFAQKWVKAGDMSEMSHAEIMAWRRTYKERPDQVIDYADNFAGQYKTKSFDTMNDVEQHYALFADATGCR